ncbi:MAG: hypothetical protein ER33_07390 [Cyanobium sp. CACIAM 14]|nr:MAG: hypothetical protein ER33_07390 [Cyanobium sp. CACIAM 14]
MMVAPDSPADPANAAEPPQAYSLEELLAVAGQRLGEGITPRTVRLYATQGLIDRPGKEGRSAVYGRRHLLQLLLIRTLARRGLSLSAIAPIVVLPDGELEQELASVLPNPAGDAANPALAYLRGLTPLLGAPLESPAEPASRRSTPARSGGSRQAASHWHRFTLAPGVELHISDTVVIPPAGERRHSWLRRLGERLIELLDNSQL